MKNLDEKFHKIEKRKNGSLRIQFHSDQQVRVQEQFKDDCDVNNIMKKYQSTGQFNHATSKQGSYKDFFGITDYHDMLNTVMYAQEAFQTLPAETRARFANDPGELLEFIQNSNNREEAMRLGLIKADHNPSTNANEQNESETKKAKGQPKEKVQPTE